MNFELNEQQIAIRYALDAICKGFGDEYWLARDGDGAFPEDFVRAIGAIKSTPIFLAVFDASIERSFAEGKQSSLFPLFLVSAAGTRAIISKGRNTQLSETSDVVQCPTVRVYRRELTHGTVRNSDGTSAGNWAFIC